MVQRAKPYASSVDVLGLTHLLYGLAAAVPELSVTIKESTREGNRSAR
jgi:hypothetical protein